MLHGFTNANHNCTRRLIIIIVSDSKMIALMSLLAMTCFFMCRPALVSATTFYVSPAGSDSNKGTSPAAPFQSVKVINAMRLAPGDRILFAGGVEHELGSVGLVVQGVDASPVSPVVISTYGDIDAPARLLVDGTLTSGVTIVDSSGVSLANLTLLNMNPNLYGCYFAGLLIEATSAAASAARYSGISVDTVTVTGFQRGILLSAVGCRGFSDVSLVRVIAKNNAISGIESVGAHSATCLSHANLLISHSVATNNTGNPTITWQWTGSGMVLSDVDGARIEWSIASHNGRLNRLNHGGPFAIWTWHSNNVTIAHCVAHHNENGTNVASSV
jgi:hypothetical protein